MQKELEIVQDIGRSYNIIVSSTKVTIKFPPTASDEDKEYVGRFFLKVAEELEAKNSQLTFRSSWSQDTVNKARAFNGALLHMRSNWKGRSFTFHS